MKRQRVMVMIFTTTANKSLTDKPASNISITKNIGAIAKCFMDGLKMTRCATS